MLNEVVAQDKQEIEVIPRHIEVLLDDEKKFPLILELPPAEELQTIQALYVNKISVKEIVDDSGAIWANAFNQQLQRNMEKLDEYSDSATFLNQLASLNELAGKPEAATDLIKQAIEKEPLLVFRHKLGTNLFFRNKLDVAKQLFTSLDLKNDAYANLRLAYLAIKEHNFVEAQQLIHAGIKADPLDFRVRLAAGAIALARGNIAEAITNFKIALDERPNSAAACVNLGIAYLCIGSRDKALKWIRRAVATNLTNANAVALLADLLIAKRDYDEAARILTSYLQIEQKDPAFWARLVRTYYEAGEWKKALETLRHQASTKETSYVWNNMALVYWKLGEIEKAQQYFSLAIKTQIEEKNPEFFALKNLLSLYIEQKKFNEILKLTEQLLSSENIVEIAQDHEGCKILSDHIIALSETQRKNEAASLAEKLLGHNKVHFDLRVNLLIFLTSYFSTIKRDTQKAIGYANEALVILNSPQNLTDTTKYILLNNVAFSMLEHNEISKAEQVMSRLSPDLHKRPFSTATLGLLHIKRGHLERGEELYREAISLTHDRTLKEKLRQKLDLELGKALLATGEEKKAKRHLEKVAKTKDAIDSYKNEAIILLEIINKKRT